MREDGAGQGEGLNTGGAIMAEVNDIREAMRGLGLEDLRALREALEALIGERERDEERRVYEQMQELAASIGKDLDGIIKRQRPKRPAATRKAKRPAEVKYQNPDNPKETWTGRGKEPKWLRDALVAGKKREDFLVVAH